MFWTWHKTLEQLKLQRLLKYCWKTGNHDRIPVLTKTAHRWWFLPNRFPRTVPEHCPEAWSEGPGQSWNFWCSFFLFYIWVYINMNMTKGATANLKKLILQVPFWLMKKELVTFTIVFYSESLELSFFIDCKE